MSEAASFYLSFKVDTATREHWKDVDRYKIYAPAIAKGDASSVFLAEGDGKRVAIKAYASQWMFDNEKILETELNGFNRLITVGLVPALLRKPLRTRNNIYLTMELCNCGSLDLMVKKKGGFPPRVIQDVARFLAASLLELHGMKLLHREINPRHILVNLDPEGKVSYKVIGLQFFKDLSKEKTSSFVGTPEYICPEAAQEIEYSYPADIWSVGVTLYELAVGATSLKVDPNFRVRVKAGELPIFPEYCDVPHGLKDLICKCLSYNPAQRPTAAQLLEFPFITGIKVSPPPTDPPPLHPPQERKIISPPSDSATTATSVSKSGHTKILSNEELIKMISTDFSSYISYVNDTENRTIKLKAEKRSTLKPYILKSAKAINKGGFSEIYLCTNEQSKEEYALKVVLTSKMVDVKIANLLLGEIGIMLDLKSSPFTIRIEDYFVYKNDLCLILEYCNGGDLDNYVRKIRRKKTAFPLEELKLVAWNVACGLNDMHKRNMMHRDIKPKNILVVEDKKTDTLVDIKLCDYGLSKKVAENDELQGSTILGTFDYFAPELYEMMERRMAGDIENMTYSFKIDVWSYGVLLYFALYGKTIMEPPGSKTQVVKYHKIHYPPVKDVPESYMTLMQKCLIFDQNKRPSFKELLNEPFFTIVVLPPRISLKPYVKGSLLGKSLNTGNKTAMYECTRDGERFALKVIDVGSVEKKRLVGEIDTLAKLKNSENVIKLIDYFVIENQVHLVMEYHNGGTLESFVKHCEDNRAPMLPEQQTLVAYCVLNGINDIHTHNIIHRGVDPNNILLSLNPDGSIKKAIISDFGFARVLVEASAMTEVFTAYKSPEMNMHEAHDAKTDIWSYGMLLYFIMFGADPMKGNDLHAILRTGTVKYDEARASANPELVAVMKRCLKVQPADRPTAFQLLKEGVFAKYAIKQ